MSDCGRCRDCKHWDQKTTSAGICEASGRWDAPVWGFRLDGDKRLSVVSTPDFGCVQFEMRERQQSMIRKDG